MQLVARSRLSLRATDRWFEALLLRGCLSLFRPLPVTAGDSGRQRPSALRIRALAASPRRRSGPSAPLSANHDLRALSQLYWIHVNPYARFELDMNSHLALAAAAAATVPGPRTPPETGTALSGRTARLGRHPEDRYPRCSPDGWIRGGASMSFVKAEWVMRGRFRGCGARRRFRHGAWRTAR